MRLRHRFAALSLPVFTFAACAVGQGLPEDAATLVVEPDAGPQAASIRVDGGARAVADADADESLDDASARDTGTPLDAATADVATPPVTPVPPPPPSAPVCDANDPSYDLLVIALILGGTPPPACSAGTCASGECCYSDEYCLPQ
jgi:hypothetical protein